MTASPKMKYQIGMNEVYSPPRSGKDAQTPIANIVFIHGLFGHPWKTWADENVKGTAKPFWPENLLPNVVPNVRIYSFGYDADVERFMSSAGLNTVHQHGRKLLNDLCDLLDKYDSKIPFIFIAHSLGGLVLKEALNQSSGTETKRGRQVADLTYGIIFLGTPHRGSAVASYGKMAFLLTKIFAGQSANTQLLRALEKNSETLDRVNSTFYETLKKYKSIHLFSFFEEKETRKVVFGMRIVPPECARIGDEDWGGIPENHRYMAKYRSDTDPGFKKVSNVVKRWVVGIEEDDKNLYLRDYKDCLNSLDDPSARARVQQVSQQHKDSFEWLFSDEVGFSRWLKDDKNELSPLFWITGKPGSGKSTLMRFAMQDPRTVDSLPNGIGHPVAYFFHLRGKSRIQKSLNGMLLEITFQILSQFPDFFLSIQEIYTDLLRVSRDKKPEWTTGRLKQCVMQIPHFFQCQSARSRTRVILFIDALDENEDQSENREVVSIIKELAESYSDSVCSPGEGPILKICLASRPWPIFQKELGDEKRVINFAIHEHTKEDIRLYCRSRLSSAIADRKTFKDQVQHWTEMIEGKAHGVFVWVRLVVDYLCRNILDGTPYSHLEKYFESLPDELSDLYEFTLARIPKEYALEALVSLRILLASRTTLGLNTLYCATLSCTSGYDHSMNKVLKEDKLAWLRSRTGGLIELAVNDTADEAFHLQFIHQTAQEFVFRGLSGLDIDSNKQDWIYLDGNFFIYKAIEGRYPPFLCLLPLARDLFHYVKAIDQLCENDTFHQAIQRTGNRNSDNYTSIIRGLYEKQGGWIEISNDDLGRFYTASENRRVFISLMTWIDRATQLEDTFYRYDNASNTAMRSWQPPSLSGLKDIKCMSYSVCLSLILHGVYFVDYRRFSDSQIPALLLLVALGPRFTAVSNFDRCRLFRKFCVKSRASNFDVGSLRLIPNIISGVKHHFVSQNEPRNLLEALVFCEEHPNVDEDTRFNLAVILLDTLPESGRHNMIGSTIGRNRVPMSLLGFCARFKSRQWTDLVYCCVKRDRHSLDDYIPLAAALGKDHIAFRHPISYFAPEFLEPWEDYSEEVVETSDCCLIPAMIAAIPVWPSIYKTPFKVGYMKKDGNSSTDLTQS